MADVVRLKVARALVACSGLEEVFGPFVLLFKNEI